MNRIEELAAKTEGKNSRFTLFDTAISPGERASLGLPLPEMLGYAPPLHAGQGGQRQDERSNRSSLRHHARG
jgi:hypothetical protein